MEWYMYLAVIAAGLFAGFVNTLAGSGSLITLPLLMFLGLPANIANGTNRIGVFVQSLVSSISFRKQKLYTAEEGLWMSVPAVAGALLGSLMAVRINERIMELLIGGLLIIMFFIILYKPEQWVKEHAQSAMLRRRWWVPVIVFFHRYIRRFHSGRRWVLSPGRPGPGCRTGTHKGKRTQGADRCSNDCHLPGGLYYQ